MRKRNKSANVPLLNRRFFLLSAGSFAATTLIASCSAPNNAPSGGGTAGTPSSPAKLKVGVSPVPHGEILKYVKENLAPAAGLDIDIVEFSDFVLPNLALQDKTLDANYFQHVPYMEDFGKQRGIDLVKVVPVHIEPLGLYSKKIKSLSEVKDGAKVSIPNDATNLGRALKLLEANNLLKLKSGAGVGATLNDIESNPKKLNFIQLEAAQLPRALDDVDFGVVNGNFALAVGFVPEKDALALESAKDNPYANVLAVLRGRENDPNIIKLGQLLNTPEVKKFIDEKYQGSVIAAFD